MSEAQKLIAEIEKVFSDRSRSQKETADILCEVAEHIEMLLDSLDINYEE